MATAKPLSDGSLKKKVLRPFVAWAHGERFVLNAGIPRQRKRKKKKQFWAELQRIYNEEAYSCNLRLTIRADTRRSICHLQRSHPSGPMFHCYSAYSSQTHCNLQGRERKTQQWVVRETYTKETGKQICRWSVADSPMQVLPDEPSCFISIRCAKVILPCNQTLKETATAWNRKDILRMEKLAEDVRSALRH